MLLRHNSVLKNWYKFFASKYESTLSENTFALNLEGFWKIARDVHYNFHLGQTSQCQFFPCSAE